MLSEVVSVNGSQGVPRITLFVGLAACQRCRKSHNDMQISYKVRLTSRLFRSAPGQLPKITLFCYVVN